MPLGPQLALKQQHRLVITPALRQSLFLLQVPTLELQGLVQQEMMENPFLQEPDDGEAVQNDTQEREDGPPAEAAEATPAVDQTKELTPETPPAEEGLSMKEWDDYFASESSDLGYMKEMDPQDEDRPYERAGNRTETLAEFLLEQLQLSDVEERVQNVAKLIIGNLDHQGYLRATLDDIEQTEQVSKEDLEHALTLVQTFEPSGVGARDLQECLLIQLRERELSGSVAARMLRECWTDFEHKRWHAIAKTMSVSHDEIQRAVDVVATLNPKPGRNFSQDPPQYVMPDVIVEDIEGRLVVRVNDDGLPLLKINRRYIDMLRHQPDLQAETKKFIEEKLQSAIWLVKGIEQRKRSIYKVAEAIIDIQRDFFSKGIEGLKPLTLQEVANRVGLHESTISRITMHKYMQTPRGILRLKFFFTHAVSSHDLSGTSVASVKEVIRDLVEAEDPAMPWSDQQLVDQLAGKGITVARRTMAKYREELGFAAASLRRRHAPTS